MFGEDTGPQLWLNEIMVTKSIGLREYQKHNYETAANYFERVLNVADDDSDTRVMLTKCQQNTFRLISANDDLLSAHDESPDRLSAWENRAHVLYDHHDEFEYSLMKYMNGMKRRRQPPTFTLGALKVLGILDNAIDMRKPKYGKSCLGNTMLKLAEHSDLKNVPNLLNENGSCRTTDYYYSLYLGHLNQDRKYFLETLKTNGAISGGPFGQKIRNNMKCVVDASNVASDQLYLKKRFYIYKCEASVLKGERYRSQLNKLKIVKDMKQLQIAKYLNNIIQLIIHKKLKEAIQMTRLMINFMERIHYSSNRILDLIYRSFGVAQYLMFRFIDGLNEEKNHQRILILLGANEITNCIPLQESIIGPYDSNPKTTINILWSHIKKSKCIMERIYLSFETAKCHIQLGSDNFIKARNKGRDCLQLAQKINSHTWVANSLILLSTIEFRLNNKTECFGGLTKAIEISRMLRVSGVEQFLKKTIEVMTEKDVKIISRHNKKQMEILAFIPDIVSRMDAMCTFRRLNSMPVNRQMSLARGTVLEDNNSKYTAAQAAHKYLSIVPGSQTQRLGVLEFMAKKRVKINVKIPSDT